MTHFLRHAAARMGVRPRPDGYVGVLAMLGTARFRGLAVTEAEVRHTVGNCPKRRFGLTSECG